MALCQWPDGCKAHTTAGADLCKSHLTRRENEARFQTRSVPEAGHPQGAPLQENPPGVDPMIVAGAMQQLLLKQEIADRLRVARSRQKERDGQGYELPQRPRLPFKVVPRRVVRDSTIPVDPATGKPLLGLRSDWVQRWVRTRDHNDRPTQARVAEFEEYGFETVRCADGSLCESRFGVLMTAPPEQAALRSKDKTPTGAVMRDEALLLAEEWAESVNRVVGDNVARVVIGSEHKSETSGEL